MHEATVATKLKRSGPVGCLQVLTRWRMWAPLKHARRRQVRDAVIALHKGTRLRLWKCLRQYTAKRRVKRAAKQRAHQHCR